MKNPQIPVAKEGIPFLGLGSLVTVVMAILGYDFFAILSLAATAFILYFFRDPERICPDGDDVLVSPADGRVIRIEKVYEDRFVNEQVYRLSIFMNVFNVHVNRFPCNGTVEMIAYAPGKFYSANTVRSGIENENCALMLSTPDDKKIALVQIAGLIARRIVCWAEKGDMVQKGERLGLIRFGSRVDLYLPLQTQLEVAVGQKVKAGETIIGYLS